MQGGIGMYDVIALGELLIDFAAKETDADGYPTMKANPGGAPGNFLAAFTGCCPINGSVSRTAMGEDGISRKSRG